MDEKTIENNFTYHAPKGDQIERYAEIRAGMRRVAELVNDLCPDSREKAIAMGRLEEASMWANASIARNED